MHILLGFVYYILASMHVDGRCFTNVRAVEAIPLALCNYTYPGQCKTSGRILLCGRQGAGCPLLHPLADVSTGPNFRLHLMHGRIACSECAIAKRRAQIIQKTYLPKLPFVRSIEGVLQTPLELQI